MCMSACVYVCCVCVCVARTHGYMEQLDVNTITLNPIQTLQRPSLTTISGEGSNDFTARYARLPTQALF